jgi:hypothetical protein
MTSIVNSIKIAGPVEAIFDLVTSARFWPEWHPASQGVGGVTQRPYRLGDTIREKVRIGPSDFQVTWNVVEHERPTRVVLDSQIPRVRITYTFRPCDGGVDYSRALEYDDTFLHAVAPDLKARAELMHQQSELALQRLKALVERILRSEKTDSFEG